MLPSSNRRCQRRRCRPHRSRSGSRSRSSTNSSRSSNKGRTISSGSFLSFVIVATIVALGNGLIQVLQLLRLRLCSHTETKSFLDEASDPPVELPLNHEEVCWEYYTGRHFAVPELVPGVDRHHETKFKLNAYMRLCSQLR